MIYFDTETCGLHGLAVLLQYAKDDGPIHMHNFWKSKVRDSMKLIEEMLDETVCGFNLAFDMFHVAKMYTLLRLCPQDKTLESINRDQLGIWESEAREGPCIRARKCLDLMLFARKGKYQSTMDRGDIRIKRVPTQLAWTLSKELDKRIIFDSILFEKRQDRYGPRFKVKPSIIQGEEDVNFKDILLSFKPSTSLKSLAIHALKIDPQDIMKFGDINLPKTKMPKELGYAPFAMALGKPGKWNGTWPDMIQYHIDHWSYNENARKYAHLDVDYTRRLNEFFGFPEPGDDDSELAGMVGQVRWAGFTIDIPKLKALRDRAKEKIKKIPTSPSKVKKWIYMSLSDMEKTILKDGTAKKALLDLARDPLWEGTEVAEKANAVLEARAAQKEIEIFDKLILAGRFHASVKVIGSLSSRMSGADGLNPQGIKKSDEVRECFPLGDGEMPLAGGDFSGFELGIAQKIYNDPQLMKDLTTCEKCRDVCVERVNNKKVCPKCGGSKTMKVHAFFGMQLYPEMSYDEIKATDGTTNNIYTKAKSGLFALIYFGEAYTLHMNLSIPMDVAERGYEGFLCRYQGIAQGRNRIKRDHSSIHQAGGIGTKISYKKPAEFAESLLGFRRYFTLENMVVKELFDLASNPPEHWNEFKIKVRRRDRDQLALGALRTALYAAAFQVQGSSIRAAGNHEVQCSGAQMTKKMQRNIWDLQPVGVHKFVVKPLNIHDEIMCPTVPEYRTRVAEIVHKTIEEYRPLIPLIEMEWSDLKTWADKS